MIKVTLTNEMLTRIISIERLRNEFKGENVPPQLSVHLRKNSQKRSAHSSTKIEGNPLSEAQAAQVIDDPHRHLLKPEEEVRNYYNALELLDKCLENKTPLTIDLLLAIQKKVMAGASAEKIGLRKPMPPGFLFAVYDGTTGEAEYIPPDALEIESLLHELFRYLQESNDHPLIKAAIAHYQIATIHPFEDGNGRTARLISGYCLSYYGFGFGGYGSLEEYFAYDIDEYYRSLQMNLPALYYNGRDNPPHPELWVEYFLRMVELYAQRTSEQVNKAVAEQIQPSLSHLSQKERAFYTFLQEHAITEYRPTDIAKEFDVSNRTIINWSASLAKVGLVEPQLVKQRIRSYKVAG